MPVWEVYLAPSERWQVEMECILGDITTPQ